MVQGLLSLLPQKNRIRTTADFSLTRRSGSRYGSRNVVVYLNKTLNPQENLIRVGFVVSKAVGNAVTRNRVKRRMRAIAYQDILGDDDGSRDIVFTALPPSAEMSFTQLRSEMRTCLAKAEQKFQRRQAQQNTQ